MKKNYQDDMERERIRSIFGEINTIEGNVIDDWNDLLT